MTLMRHRGFDFTRAGSGEALFGAALGLHLGHFGSFQFKDLKKGGEACPLSQPPDGSGRL
jgi:hypothetical protein